MKTKQSFFLILFFDKIESPEYGPLILTLLSISFLITGLRYKVSSLPIVLFSPACGLIPEIINLGFFILKSFIRVLFKLKILSDRILST